MNYKANVTKNPYSKLDEALGAECKNDCDLCLCNRCIWMDLTAGGNCDLVCGYVQCIDDHYVSACKHFSFYVTG